MENEKPEKTGKSPGFWFYPSDYERDMQMLSLASQGLWMRMLCWMHQNEERRGFLTLPSGEPMTRWDIASRVGKPTREVESCLKEMERVGVYTTSELGVLFCRRMVRETHISKVRSTAAKSRRSIETSEVCSTFAIAKVPTKEQQKGSVTASASVSDTHTHKRVQNLQRSPSKQIEQGAAGSGLTDRFSDWLRPWPRVPNPDQALRWWISVVKTPAHVEGAFAARDRYLSSEEVSRGIVQDPGKFLEQQSRGAWNGKWPSVAGSNGGGTKYRKED